MVLRPAALAALLLGPAAALACEPLDANSVGVDRPIAVAPDGSFADAAREDRWGYLLGGPVRDIGGGRVGQVIESDWGCHVVQELLFVDCTTGSAILVPGLYARDDELGGPADVHPLFLSARMLQAPHGPLALTPATTVAEVAALAAREGWEVELDVPAFAAERGPQNAFDPFRGCEMLYPGSVGAGR